MKRKQGAKLAMKWMREILRFHLELKLGNNEIARTLGRSQSTVSQVLKSAKSAGIDAYNLVEVLSDDELEMELKVYKIGGFTTASRSIPDWSEIHKENQDRKSTRLNSSHIPLSRMPSSA